MKIIAMDGRAGKITRLIELCAKNGGYIVCRQRSVNLITARAQELGVSIPYPLSYGEFVNRRYYPNGIKKVYIDDLDALLNYISRVPIEAVTVDKNLVEVN